MPHQFMKIEIEKGQHITSAAQQAINVAKINNCRVEFEFSGTELSVSPRSCAEDIAIIYFYKRECERMNRE